MSRPSYFLLPLIGLLSVTITSQKAPAQAALASESSKPPQQATSSNPETSQQTNSEFVAPTGRSANDATIGTRETARVIDLRIPAPRGLITDRKGRILATNKTSYLFGLDFPEFRNPTDEHIISWARRRLKKIKQLLGDDDLGIDDKELIDHYRHRRWLPLLIPNIVTSNQYERWKDELTQGIVLQAQFLRHYPEKSTAAHIIGYVRSKGKLPTGPITQDEPMWEETYGAEGLEAFYDERLKGKDGHRRMMYDSDGSELQNEITSPPVIGDTIVTSLDLRWQAHAESVLRRYCRRGAFVVIDIHTGDVVVLASRPSYDLNLWIPRISPDEYAKLNDEDNSKLYALAYRGAYPPASAFKPVVALSALSQGVIYPGTTFNCPPFIKIGSRKFWNHTRKHAGRLNVKAALALSNNPWFYQVGMKTGHETFLSLARRLGYGSKTGLPLTGEYAGIIPDDQVMLEVEGRPMTDGDTAQSAIGQGTMAATPLQVAQAMAGIGNGTALPRLRLVLQIQDHEGNVLVSPGVEERNQLGVTKNAVRVVHQGMRNVVHASYGTGKRGAVNFCTVCGKTGTGDWIGTLYNVAWFAGFLPYDNPRYAFAALYEGRRGESLSGGRKAAPMIPAFFNRFGGEIMSGARPAARAAIIDENGAPVEESPEIDPREIVLRALPIDGPDSMLPVPKFAQKEENADQEASETTENTENTENQAEQPEEEANAAEDTPPAPTEDAQDAENVENAENARPPVNQEEEAPAEPTEEGTPLRAIPVEE